MTTDATAARTERIHDAIVVLWVRGFGPTLQEIQEYAGISSVSVVYYHLHKLRLAGRVTWEEGKARTIRVTT